MPVVRSGAAAWCVAAAVGSGWCSAMTLVESTFDTGDDGWRVADLWGSANQSAPEYVGSAGGGFVRTADLYGWNAFRAPAAYLGNQSGAYGGTLHVEQRVESSDGLPYPLAVMTDGTLYLQYRAMPPAVGQWAAYDVALAAGAGWEVADFSGNPGPAATEAQLRQVLGNLVQLTLEADWHSGGDAVDMDNVRLVAQSAGLVGDTNDDGVVDLVDLNNVLNTFGATGSGALGDDNADGAVDLADLNNVLNHFGETAAGVGALSVVPEPVGVGIAGAVAVVAGRRRRR